jgi:hypothetical protein
MYDKYIKNERFDSVIYPDYRERYVLNISNDVGTSIRIYIYPNMFFTDGQGIFNFNMKNSIFIEFHSDSLGAESSINELWEELKEGIENRLKNSGISNFDLNRVANSADKENMQRIEVNFSSELSDDEKINIRNRNMAWKNNVH